MMPLRAVWGSYGARVRRCPFRHLGRDRAAIVETAPGLRKDPTQGLEVRRRAAARGALTTEHGPAGAWGREAGPCGPQGGGTKGTGGAYRAISEMRRAWCRAAARGRRALRAKSQTDARAGGARNAGGE
jgi:hypothetical protein